MCHRQVEYLRGFRTVEHNGTVRALHFSRMGGIGEDVEAKRERGSLAGEPEHPNSPKDGGKRTAMEEANREAPALQGFLGAVRTTHFGFMVYDHDLELVERVKWAKGGDGEWHRIAAGLMALRYLAFPIRVTFNLKPYESIALTHEGFWKWGWTRLTRAYGAHYVRITNYGVWSEDVVSSVHRRPTLDHRVLESLSGSF